jgi:hypothetical protein
MSTTDALAEALADPLAAALAVALTPPVIELYAVLWRFGFVEILQTRSMSYRASTQLRLAVALARMPACQRETA